MRRALVLIITATFGAGLCGPGAYAAETAPRAPMAPMAPRAPTAAPAAETNSAGLPLYIDVFGAKGEAAPTAVKASAVKTVAAPPPPPTAEQLAAMLNAYNLPRGATRDYANQPPMVIQEMSGELRASCERNGGAFKVVKMGVFACG